jgi:hypothetical protein
MHHASRHSLDVCVLDARLADDARYTWHDVGLRGRRPMLSSLFTGRIGAFTLRRAKPGRKFSLLDMRAGWYTLRRQTGPTVARECFMTDS